jgi:hypothetical protein
MKLTQNGPKSIDQVKKHFEFGNLLLSPEEYQRENAWTLDQKKLLIDTIFRGLDIPKFYVWKIDDKTLADGYPDGELKEIYRRILDEKRKKGSTTPYIFEVVDGQQRIRTILEFMGVKLPPNVPCYRGVWHDAYRSLPDTPKAKGRRYEQLDAEQQLEFDQAALTIMVLEDATIDEIRDMFLRLQNGTPLNSQQKRDATGSRVSGHVHKLIALPFFSQDVDFDNGAGEHHRVAAQMLLLESKDAIVSCTSQQLDKFYDKHKGVDLDHVVVDRTHSIVKMLGGVFAKRTPGLNRSYAVGLYWTLSRILKTYQIEESEYATILANFVRLDQSRLEAMNREYSVTGDDLYEDLSQSMSRGTDGSEQISARYRILTQFLFDGVALKPSAALDPQRCFTYEERLILYRRAGGKCQLGCNGSLCGREVDFDDGVVDHIKPHSQGGLTTLDNGRYANKRCNTARGVRDDFDPKTDCCLLQHDGE